MIEFALDQRYEKSQFMAFLKTFLPDDYVQQDREVEISFTSNHITEATSLGACKSLDLEVYEVHHTSLNDARVGLSKDAFRLLLDQSLRNRALVVFIPEEGNQWRFSLLQMEAEVSDHSSRITRSYSNPRRYSFLLGEGAHIKTPHQFLFEKGQIRERKESNKNLSLWDDLLSRFSVEVLTKEFYDKLYCWYQWAVDENTGVYYPNNPDTPDDDRQEISSNIIRLITRLLFVWFIKEKGLVPTEIFDKDGLNKILVDFNPNDSNGSNYYNAILQNLFFATLNNEIDKRAFVKEAYQGRSSSRGVKNLFRDNSKSSWFNIPHEEVLKIFHKVPYMNCGLFECLDKYAKSDIGKDEDTLIDGFSTSDSRDKETGRYTRRAFVPNALFFAPEHKETITIIEDKKKKQITIDVKGIITLLKEYNFTIEENTPTEVQVSLDPELLGRVFENLLAAYNPETGASARKSTGSFYTPREIVEYMVNESLVAYLKTKVSKGEELEAEFRKLINYQDEETSLSESIKDECLKALYDCKVLDPACGSGAFPMGMLLQMVHIIKQLDPNNEKWKQVVLDKAIEESKIALMNESKETRHKHLEEIEKEFDDNMTNPDYKRKLYIIQNCIYGVDILPVAMLISKLRFFISLVCEQNKIDFNDIEGNYGINTLPNLETKFVAANTLLPTKINNYSGDWTIDKNLAKLKDDLIDIRMRHFRVKTQTSKRANREKDEQKRHEILKYIISSTTKPDDVLIDALKEQIKKSFLELNKYREIKIEEQEVSLDLFGNTKKVTIDVNAKQRRALQDNIKKCEEQIKREENKKNPAGFEIAVKEVTEWNPYDQNASAPFFSPEWMFGVENGFNIVIGNPPYGADIKADEKKIYQEEYITTKTIKDVQKGSLDTYTLFIEKGFNSLVENGILAYIIPISITSSDSLSGVHRLLYDNCNTIRISSYAVRPKPVFENAMVNTSILLFEKTCTQCQYVYSTKMYRRGAKFNLQQLVNNLEFAEVSNYLKFGRIPKISSKIETSILEKLQNIPTVGDYKDDNGLPIWYRFAGGRYFKVITNYATNSSAEKPIYLSSKYANSIGCILSSNLSFWFYQIYSDNLNWKACEIESFPIPDLSTADIVHLEKLYVKYLNDIEEKANIRISSGKSTYHVSQFKEYKIVRSKKIIDEIDDYIYTLYGLTTEEIGFIKSYELEFRMSGDE